MIQINFERRVMKRFTALVASVFLLVLSPGGGSYQAFAQFTEHSVPSLDESGLELQVGSPFRGDDVPGEAVRQGMRLPPLPFFVSGLRRLPSNIPDARRPSSAGGGLQGFSPRQIVSIPFQAVANFAKGGMTLAASGLGRAPGVLSLGSLQKIVAAVSGRRGSPRAAGKRIDGAAKEGTENGGSDSTQVQDSVDSESADPLFLAAQAARARGDYEREAEILGRIAEAHPAQAPKALDPTALSARADPRDTVIVAVGPSRSEVEAISQLAREMHFAGVKIIDSAEGVRKYADLVDWNKQYIEVPANASAPEMARIAERNLKLDAGVRGKAALIWPAPGHEVSGGALVDLLRSDSTRLVLGNPGQVAVLLQDEAARLEAVKPLQLDAVKPPVNLGRTYRVGFRSRNHLLGVYRREVNGKVILSSRRDQNLREIAVDAEGLKRAYRSLRDYGVDPGDMLLQRVVASDGPQAQVESSVLVQKVNGKLKLASKVHADVYYEEPAAREPIALVSPSQMPSGPLQGINNLPVGRERSLALAQQRNHIRNIEQAVLLFMEKAGIEGLAWRVITYATPRGPQFGGIIRDTPRGDLEFRDRKRGEIPTVRGEILSLLGLAENQMDMTSGGVLVVHLVRAGVQGILKKTTQEGKSRPNNRQVGASTVLKRLIVQSTNIEQAVSSINRELTVRTYHIQTDQGKVQVSGTPIVPSSGEFEERFRSKYDEKVYIYQLFKDLEWWRSVGFIAWGAFKDIALLLVGGPQLLVAFMFAYSAGCIIGNFLGGPILAHVPVRTLAPNGTLARGFFWGGIFLSVFLFPHLAFPVLVLGFIDGVVTAPAARINFDSGMFILGSAQHHLALDEEDSSGPIVELRSFQAQLQVFFRFFAYIPILLLSSFVPVLKAATGEMILVGIAGTFLASGLMMFRTAHRIPSDVDMGNNGKSWKLLGDVWTGGKVILRHGILTFRFISNIASKVVALAILASLVPTTAFTLAAHWFPGDEFKWVPLIIGVLTGIGYLGAMITSLGMRAVPEKDPNASWGAKINRRLYALCRRLNFLPQSVKGLAQTGWLAPDDSVSQQKTWERYKPFFSLVLVSASVTALIVLALQGVVAGWVTAGAAAIALASFFFNYFNIPSDVGLTSLWQSTIRLHGKDDDGRDAVGGINSLQSLLMMIVISLTQGVLAWALYGSWKVDPKQMGDFLFHLTPEHFTRLMHWAWGIVGAVTAFGLFENFIAPSWMGLKPKHQTKAGRTSRPQPSGSSRDALAESDGPAADQNVI